jgi:hypothetical protein
LFRHFRSGNGFSSRDASASEFCLILDSPPRNKPRGRSAGRRKFVWSRATSANVAVRRCTERGSAPCRGALAFRRSTAALARPNVSSLGSAPVPAFPETRLDGRYPFSPVSSLPSSSEAGRDAGRAVAQSRPGTVCETVRRRRARPTLRTAPRRAIMRDLT